MARETSPAQSTEIEPTTAEASLIQDAKLLHDFARMAGAIPMSEGNPIEDILRVVLTAKTWDDLDKPWDTADLEDVLNRAMRVTDIKRRPSRYAGGLGVFLIVTLVNPKTGEKVVKTTGSLNVVAQLTRAYFLGVTAMTVVWRQSDPNLETGFQAQHLDIVDAHTPEITHDTSAS